MTRDDNFIESDLDTLFSFDPHMLFALQIGYLWEGSERKGIAVSFASVPANTHIAGCR